MNAGITLTAEQHAALLELLKAACTVFWGPDHEICRKMLREDYFLPLDTIAAAIITQPPEAAGKLKALINACPNAETLYDQLEDAYVPLFVNARGGIAAPLYHSCYVEEDRPSGSGPLMGAPALRMQQLLAGAGLSLEHSANEPPDHLAVELEYLFYLLQKNRTDPTARSLPEAVAFVKSDLLPWVPRFEKRLRAAAPNSFYALTAAVLVAVLHFIADL